jgi:hypothetical protein
MPLVLVLVLLLVVVAVIDPVSRMEAISWLNPVAKAHARGLSALDAHGGGANPLSTALRSRHIDASVP